MTDPTPMPTDSPAHRPTRAGGASVPWLAAAALAAIYFCYTLPLLGWLPLAGGMEANVVIAAREAVRDGHWFPGTQNGAPRLRKPPLAHWTTAVGVMTARRWPSATAARWPSLLMASITVGAVAVLGALVLGREGAVASGLVAGTTLLFITYARKASYDTQVTLWTTLADVGLAYALFRRKKAGLIVAGVALGLGMMTKGPVVLLLSAAPPAAYALVRWWRDWDDDGDLLRQTPQPAGARAGPRGTPGGWVGAALVSAAIVLAISLPWAVAIVRKYPYMTTVWLGQVQRAPDQTRKFTDWFAYLSIVPNLWPWIVWTAVGAAVAVYGRGPRDRRALAMVMWVLLPVVVMSFFPGRRTRYAVPIVAPAAVVAVCGLRSLAAATGAAARAARSAHWLMLVAPVLIALPACALGFKPLLGADGAPTLSYSVAAAGLLGTLAALFIASRLRDPVRRIVYGTTLVMAVAYPVSLVAYSKMPSAIPEGESFIRGIVSAHPDAVFYSAHPRYHDPPLETVVYADRVLWKIADERAIRPADREQILMREEPRKGPPPPLPETFRLLGRHVIDNDPYAVYLLPATPGAPPPPLPPVLPDKPPEIYLIR